MDEAKDFTASRTEPLMGGADVSIIIRTFNEREYLPALLEGIRDQRYSRAEVIVVDSGSYDGTPEWAETAGARVVRIDSRDSTFGYSLNVGLRHSDATYAVLVSAHTRPVDAHWLEELVAPLCEGRTAMVYGRQLGAENESKFSETQDLRRGYGPRRLVLKPPRFFGSNANAAIPRALWDRFSFDESLPGLEDIAWVKHWMEQGYRVVYEPRAAIYHIHLHRETWGQVRRRYYREGVAARRIGIKRRRGIPLDLGREAKNTIADIWRAGTEGKLVRLSKEIFLFRFHKTMGTLSGLWDGAIMDDPARRQAVFFDKVGMAVWIHAPRRASLDEVTVPPVKPGDVLIKVAYVGVCGTDREIYEGTLGYYRTGIGKYPIVPGHEFSGRVMQFGSNVDGLERGDAVVAECIQTCGQCPSCEVGNWVACSNRQELGVIGRNGGYAQYVVVPGRFVHRLPAGMELKKAALCEPLAVVNKGLHRLERAWPNGMPKRCAVVGGGPLGHLCARVLSLQGHEVTVFDRNPERLKFFRGTGIRTESTMPSLGEYEGLVEATGDPDSLTQMMRKSAPGVAILLLGLPYAKREFSFEDVVAYDKTIVGSVGSGRDDFQAAIKLLERLDLSVLTRTVLPLEKFLEAWEESRRGRRLKILLEVDGSL